jgi:predicted permease
VLASWVDAYYPITMSVVLDTIVPVFSVIALGFWLAGRRKLDVPTLADLALLVTAPALVFSVLSETTLEPQRGLILLGGTVWIIVGTMAAAGLYVWTQGEQLRGLIHPAVFWNAGNMALPCARLAFGAEGLEAGIIIYVVVAVLTFSVGIWLAKGRSGWQEVLRMPLIYAAAAGLGVAALGAALPRMLSEPVRMLGDMAIPLMLLNLGIQLRRLQVTDVRHSRVAVAIRMGGGLALALLFVGLFRVGGVERQVLLLGSVMPAAVINVVIAQRYDTSPSLVASAIVLGTGLSLFVIPTLIYFVA